MELDVLERLPRACEGRLSLGCPVRIVERRPQRPPLGERAEIPDGERGRQPALGDVEPRDVESKERRQLAQARPPPSKPRLLHLVLRHPGS